ncbi:MAG: SDR family oxidoreductase [Chloroflexi bacterium]|nr:SDR family oxidoreductase [Chloroflexota bacterium]
MTVELPADTEGRDRGAVLITGASTGIGRACALHLDRLGFRVLAGVRKSEDGDALRAEASARLAPVLIDITDAESIAEAARRVEALAPEGLAGLVNNAGIALTGPLEFIELERVRRQFEVNVFGHLATTQAMLPALRKRGGRIVNMSSMAGWVGAPFYGPYTGSKHALRAMTDALRLELSPWDLPVVLIEPGAIDTPIWEKGLDLARDTVDALPEGGRERYADQIEVALDSIESQGRRGIPSERVAEAVASALLAHRPKARYVVGRDARLAIIAKRFLPDRVMDGLLRRQMGLPKRGAYRDRP